MLSRLDFTRVATLLVASLGLSTVHAGAYIGSSLIPNGVTFPSGYTGTEEIVSLDVCIVPGTPDAALMESSIHNALSVWNSRISTSANVRSDYLPQGKSDFESVALHELGHCVGLGHPNLGFAAGEGNEQFTQSTSGADGTFNLQAGDDGIAGTADDIRADDRNTHYFNIDSNNPFIELAVIDSGTYSNDVARLPAGDLFAASASRAVSGLPRYLTPSTEAVMQQGFLAGEIQRTLSHDDVSTLRYAMSGLDRQQGTADDYSIVMNYAGISDSEECDISIATDAARTGFAVCNVVPDYRGPDIGIKEASILFNPEIDWYYNNSPPCSHVVEFPSNAWVAFSPPCTLGVSTSATVADVLGTDLDSSLYGQSWAVYEHTYLPQPEDGYIAQYRELVLSDELQNGRGYWVLNTAASVSVDIQGEYSSQLDSPVFVDAGNSSQYGWNLLGQPFRFPTVWADTLVVDENGQVLTLSQADPFVTGPGSFMPASASCADPSDPQESCVVSGRAFAYNSDSQKYDTLDRQTGIIDPARAIWVFAGKDNAAIRFSMPVEERNSP